jgi:hypothetical protein
MLIAFIALTHSNRNYKWYSAIADLHTSEFTVTHTLGFSVFTSRILATDFNTVIITCKVFSSQAEFQVSTELVAFLSQSSSTAASRDSLKFISTESESESYVTTDGQSASLSWIKAPNWALRPNLYYWLKIAGLLMWGALSDERTGLSFTIAAGLRQRSHSRVRVPWDSRPYF